MNILRLDLSDPDIASALSDCEVGKPKTLTVTVVPTKRDGTIFEADVEKVSYSDSPPDEENPEEDVPVDSETSEEESGMMGMPNAVKAIRGSEK